jgi:hypothetical protein
MFTSQGAFFPMGSLECIVILLLSSRDEFVKMKGISPSNCIGEARKPKVFARVSRSERRNARSHEPVGNRLVAYLTLN